MMQCMFDLQISEEKKLLYSEVCFLVINYLMYIYPDTEANENKQTQDRPRGA